MSKPAKQAVNPPKSPTDDAAMRADVDAHVAPKPEQVTLGGHSFDVAPLKVKQFFPLLQAIRPLTAALVSRPSSPRPGLPPDEGGQAQGGDLSPADQVDAALNDADWILAMFEQHGPTVIHALAIGLAPIHRDQAKWDENIADTEAAIEELDLVDLVVLLKHFVTVNAGFFVDRGLKLPRVPGLNLAADVAAAAQPRPSSKS